MLGAALPVMSPASWRIFTSLRSDTNVASTKLTATAANAITSARADGAARLRPMRLCS